MDIWYNKWYRPELLWTLSNNTIQYLNLLLLLHLSESLLCDSYIKSSQSQPQILQPGNELPLHNTAFSSFSEMSSLSFNYSIFSLFSPLHYDSFYFYNLRINYPIPPSCSQSPYTLAFNLKKIIVKTLWDNHLNLQFNIFSLPNILRQN